MVTHSRRQVIAAAVGAFVAATSAPARAACNVRPRLVAIVVEHLGVDPAQVTDVARLMDDLGADSLDLLELAMAAEEEFGVEIPDDAAESIKTFGGAVNYFQAKACTQS
jgi:acyl carrier protein